MAIHFGSSTPKVEHWLLATIGTPADAGPPPLPSGCDARPARFPAPSGDGGPSLFRFEGTASCRPHGDVVPRSRAVRDDRPPRAHRVPLQQEGTEARAVTPLENSRASTSIFVLQATKSQR